MAFTYKLARRLAMSRLAAATLLMVVGGCTAGDDLIGVPGQSPIDNSLAAVVLAPRAVTAEVGQRIQLTAYGRSPVGDTLAIDDVIWSASGGTISPNGVFLADQPGTYTLSASANSGKKRGSSTVTVVPSPGSLASVVIDPDSISMTPGGAQAFSAVGEKTNGKSTPIGVDWSATGGSIDAGGLFTAGSETGLYRVIATNASTGLADTATVSIQSAPSTQPSEPVASVTELQVKPGSITLQPGASQAFAAQATMSDGSVVPATVTFAATGGTVSTAGLYTAGNSAGSYRVVVKLVGGDLADTADISIAAPAPSNSDFYPHIPAGLERVAENSFDGLPGSGRGVEFVKAGGQWRSSGSNLSAQTDAGAPQSSSGVDQVRWPAGINDGNGGGAYFDCDFDRPYKELYVSWRVKIPTSTFENQVSPGVKLLGYLSYGKTDRQNQFFLQMMSTSESNAVQSGPWKFRTDFTSEYALSGSSNQSQDYFDNQGAGAQFRPGTWQQVELYFRLNDDGRENGVYKLWVNGVLVQSYTNVTMINSSVGATRGIYRLHFDPIWGGNIGQVKQRDDYMLIDHVYVAGIPQ